MSGAAGEDKARDQHFATSHAESQAESQGLRC